MTTTSTTQDISDPAQATPENLDGARANAIYERLRKSCRDRHADEARRNPGHIVMRQVCVCGHPDKSASQVGRLCRRLDELREAQPTYQHWIDIAQKLHMLLTLTESP